MDVDKNELRKQFSKDWEKHYRLDSLVERGFERRQCQACGRNFWSSEERERCGDSACIGYQFIGSTPVKTKLGYVETWKAIEKYFTKNNHGYVKPFPTVAKWRDDLYFTIASITDFQPYVVSGELEPPHNPLIVPQACVRFPDISNVGVTGRHYTNFVMVGQHAFNTRDTGLFYWKDEAIRHDLNYMKALGIPEREIVFQEDVWAGGGNFGPCMEYFVRGLELGNCVFMQYEVTPQGSRELKTKVIDMGAGLERLSWITSGDLTSYESVFGPVIASMKKMAGVSVPKSLFSKYARISGGLDEDEVEDIEAEKERIAKMLGISKKELFETLEPLHALYATSDHLKTLLFAVTDGMLPSNAGGGYNIRMILRRAFGFAEKFGYELDYSKIVEMHADHVEYIFPHLQEGVETTKDVLDEEKKKYLATKEKARVIVANLVSKAKGGSKGASNKERASSGAIPTDELFTLYKSNGIPPEYVSEIARENGVELRVPGNFYKLVREGEGEEPAPTNAPSKKVLASEVAGYPSTKGLFYTMTEKFEARVLGIAYGKYVILDITAFYPEGGGQVSDTGTLNGVKVKHVLKMAGVVLHEVEDPKKFRVGASAYGEVDFARRKDIARHHVVTHLLNAACRNVLGKHIWQAGAFKDEHKAHLDVTHYRRISNEELSRIELLVNRYITDNLVIQTEILPRNIAEEKYGFRLYQGGAVPGKELRIVSIGDVDSQACGGTHQMLGSTGEIGCLKIIKRESVQDGVERLVYKAGGVALRYMQERDAIIRDACSVISVSDHELVRTVDRFFTEWKQQRKLIESMSERLVGEEARQLAESGTGKPSVRVLELDAQLLRKLGTEIAAGDHGAVVLMNNQGNLVCACGKKSKYSARELLAKTVKELGGGGGGSDRIAQGKVNKVAAIKL
ncbi:MAG: alanine--tRNA ligase [Candidatus Micrarchaeota archaeon]